MQKLPVSDIVFSYIKKHTAIFITILVILGISASMYIYRCATEKVCRIALIDRIVRDHVTVTFPDGQSVRAEVVDTPASRELGLSYRWVLSEKGGMLFVFERAGKYGFWMKDMHFPIDILWLSETGLVVHIVEQAKPEDYPEKTYINTVDARYVLELKAGSVALRGITIGKKLDIGGQK